MNAFHRQRMEEMYPSLAREWTECADHMSEWFDLEVIVLEIMREVRHRTACGTDRLVQMACLYKWAPVARDLAKLPFREIERRHMYLLAAPEEYYGKEVRG